MREIKFRAWLTLSDYDEDGNDIEHHAMLTSISVHSGGEIGFSLDHARVKFGSEIVERALDLGHIEELDYEWCNWEGLYELMQYTGLKDKNGVEIYEGDIVKRNGGGILGHPKDVLFIGEIVFTSDGWKAKHHRYMLKDACYGNIYNQSELEVIGNIYENPELLK